MKGVLERSLADAAKELESNPRDLLPDGGAKSAAGLRVMCGAARVSTEGWDVQFWIHGCRVIARVDIEPRDAAETVATMLHELWAHVTAR